MTRVSQSNGSVRGDCGNCNYVCVDYAESSTVVVAGYDNTDYVHFVYCFFTFLLYNKVRVLVS